LNQKLTCGRGAYFAAFALEQQQAGLFFKRLNTSTECGLAEMNLVCGFGEVAFFVKRQEMFKLMKIGHFNAVYALIVVLLCIGRIKQTSIH